MKHFRKTKAVVVLGSILIFSLYHFSYAQESQWIPIGHYQDKEEFIRNIQNSFDIKYVPKSFATEEEATALVDKKNEESQKSYEVWKGNNETALQEIRGKENELADILDSRAKLVIREAELNGSNQSIQERLQGRALAKEEIQRNIMAAENRYLEEFKQVSFKYLILSWSRFTENDFIDAVEKMAIHDGEYEGIKTCNMVILSSETIVRNSRVIRDFIRAIVKGSVHLYQDPVVDRIDIPIQIDAGDRYRFLKLRCYEVSPFVEMPNIPYEDSSLFRDLNAVCITSNNLQEHDHLLTRSQSEDIARLIEELNRYNSTKEFEVQRIIDTRSQKIAGYQSRLDEIHREENALKEQLTNNDAELSQIRNSIDVNREEKRRKVLEIEERRSAYQQVISTYSRQITKLHCVKPERIKRIKDLFPVALVEIATAAVDEGHRLIAEDLTVTSRGRLAQLKQRELFIRPRINKYKILAKYRKLDSEGHPSFGLVATFGLSGEWSPPSSRSLVVPLAECVCCANGYILGIEYAKKISDTGIEAYLSSLDETTGIKWFVPRPEVLKDLAKRDPSCLRNLMKRYGNGYFVCLPGLEKHMVPVLVFDRKTLDRDSEVYRSTGSEGIVPARCK